MEQKWKQNVDFHVNLATIVLKTPSQQHQAVIQYDKALELVPDDELKLRNHIRYLKANAFVQLKKNQQAIENYQQILGSDSTLVPVHTNLAAQLMVEGNLKQALEHCQQALVYDPEFAEAHYNMNTVLRRLGRQEEAVRLCWKNIHHHITQYSDQNIPLSHLLHSPISSLISQVVSSPVNVVCVKWGSKYSAEYVNKLYRGIQRHLSCPYRFYCLTEDPQDLHPHIIVLKLNTKWRGWWNKVELFNPELSLEGRMLYIDLDSIIVGSLDELAQYQGQFAVLCTDGMQNEQRTGGYNSSMLCWTAGSHRHIYTLLSQHFDSISKFIYKFDHWIEMTTPSADIIQNLLPGQVVEYRQSCVDGIPLGARIVTFPLHPKPHDYPSSWISKHWI